MKTYLKNIFGLVMIGSITVSCTLNNNSNNNMAEDYEIGTFGYDYNYLSNKDSLIILKDESGDKQIIVSPKYQGKVFTSTVGGMDGRSIGWVNYRAFEAGQPDEHMNAFGGENRLWIGPEGGGYSIFIKKGDAQEFANWHTPKAIDTEGWTLVSSSDKKVELNKDMKATNFIGTDFKIGINRVIEMLDNKSIEKKLGIQLGDSVEAVAYTTKNTITNNNNFKWTPETGTVCIWMLDMYPTSQRSYTLIPFVKGDENTLGKVMTSNYFGEIPEDRLYQADGVYVFKADGKYRSKVGLSAKRSARIAANYNFDAKCLTITTFDVDDSADYLNQQWDAKANPLTGDVFNAYNDGPLEDGSQMGPFLEMESSSPARFLNPNEKTTHIHDVFHFMGSEQDLDEIVRKLIGISIHSIEK